MTKALVGSLVVAPVELPPQALPASRRVALLEERQRREAAKTAAPSPAALMRSKLGSFVQPLGSVGFVAHSVLESGGRLTVAGRTASGSPVSVQITDPRTDILPKWARRVATIMRVAWENDPWDRIIKTMLAEKQLPVDETINWNAVLTKLFTRYGFTNETEREDAIQQALITALVQRDGLDKFDPSRGTEATKAKPLPQRLTSYILQLFNWQLSGKDEVGDQMHDRLRNELTVLDAPNELGTSMADGIGSDAVSAPALTPEDHALEEAEIRSYADFREAFGRYILKHRDAAVAGHVLRVLDLTTSGEDGASVKAEWEATTGTSYSYMRRMLETLRTELLHFSRSAMAPDSSLTRLISDLRSRTMDLDLDGTTEDTDDTPGGEKAKPMSSPVSVASSLIMAAEETPVSPERRFMAMLTAAVRQLSQAGKTAAPKVVDHSILYFKMEGDPSDPRYMILRFYSPKLRMNPGTGTYRVEVGDWAVDKSLPQARIKQQLSTFVIPMMRGDVLDQDHDLLEKVIRKLRAIVWENAVEYFSVETAEKPNWKNIVKMDLQRVQDAKVTVRDEAHGVVEVAASLRESTKGRLAHRMAACAECEQDDGDERWTPARPRPRWNEEKQTWESTDDGQRGGLLGGQPANYGPKRQISLQAAGPGDPAYDAAADHYNNVVFPQECLRAMRYCGTGALQYHKTREGAGYCNDRAWDSKNVVPTWVVDSLCKQGLMEGYPAPHSRQYVHLTQAGKEALAAGALPPKQASPGGYRPTHSNIKWPQAQPGDTVYFGDTILGMGGSKGTIKTIRSDRRFLVLVPGQDQPVVVGEDRVTKLVPAKQASDANGQAPESTPSEVSSAQKAGAAAFDPALHDQEAEPSITHMAMHLESTGIDPTSDNMHAAVEGFNTARDAHHTKEASVTAQKNKFAGLKRVAAEVPEAMATALTAIEDKLREQLNNISVLKENFGITAPVGEVVEGAPAEVKEVEGAERLAGFKRIAEENPQGVEEALGEFYLAMDEVMAMTENLADNCDITLPDALPTEEGLPAKEGTGDDNPDAGLHGEMPVGGGEEAPEAETGETEGEEKAK